MQKWEIDNKKEMIKFGQQNKCACCGVEFDESDTLHKAWFYQCMPASRSVNTWIAACLVCKTIMLSEKLFGADVALQARELLQKWQRAPVEKQEKVQLEEQIVEVDTELLALQEKARQEEEERKRLWDEFMHPKQR